MDYKAFRDVMRKDIQYRRCLLIKLDPTDSVTFVPNDAITIEDIEKKIVNLMPVKGLVEAIVPFCPGVFFISFKTSSVRDNFVIEQWDKIHFTKMVQLTTNLENEVEVMELDGIKNANVDVKGVNIDVIDGEAAKDPLGPPSPTTVTTYKLLKFKCSIIPGYPIYCIKFFHIFEGKGNDSKIDSFVKRVTGSKDGVYSVVRQKTHEGTLTGVLLVYFQNEDARNHALRSLAQLKVSYNGNEVKYQEFKYEA